MLNAKDHLALIRNNSTRNTQYDNNKYVDVPMGQINMGNLTRPGDLYPEENELPNIEGGLFRVKCEVSHFAYDDPIVAPNKPGATHLHMFFGNTKSNAYSSFNSLLNTGTGTCNGEDLNRSSYWVPALLDKNGNALAPFNIAVYYKNESAFYQGANRQNEVYPDGLRMVVGNAMATKPQTTLTGGPGSAPVVGFTCGVAYQAKNVTALIPDCKGNGNGGGGPNGRALEMRVHFPQCHNPSLGTYRPDQSHMSYSAGGFYATNCPASHPVPLSSITYRIFYAPDDYDGSFSDLHLSSDIRPDGTILPGGTTLHGDWFGAWHPETMKTWIDNCNNKRVDCKMGNINKSPVASLVPRKQGFYRSGDLAPAKELIKLCPGRVFDSARALESVANCTKGRMAPK